MLNILFGMVNHAFDSDSRIPELEWIEERMYLITRAENSMRGLYHFLRLDSEKKPDKIYYTATLQQVRKYKLETHRLQEEAAAAALPLEVDFPDDAKARHPPPELAIAPDQEESAQEQEQDQHGEDQQQPQHSSPLPQQQQQLESWVGRLKEDMKAEFKEELKEQLEAQKKQMDEQSRLLMTRLDQRNEKLEAHISRLLAAFESSVGPTPTPDRG
ncbi:hypothetical protein BGZ95_004986 [Linnemannia exigua]|uniref:Uncharacterized protein n=1 Tax=Linnemannia exigua TaxID=604196 RepID=A0AAD4H1I4_9FUNG|nr:hypothetical protein BGZ95_004986 [Linnemannia exigua]